jgi:formamidopyrimidine-DNA glycosylase
LIAGIGNIYRSEILYHALIAPDRPGTDITDDEIFELYKSIRSVISSAITLRGSSIRDYRDTNGKQGEFHKFLKVYGCTGDVCLTCEATGRMVAILSTKEIDGRTVYYCRECQK